MIVHVNATGARQAEVVLPADWARMGMDMATSHALNILAAATLTPEWEASRPVPNEEADTITIKFIRRR